MKKKNRTKSHFSNSPNAASSGQSGSVKSIVVSLNHRVNSSRGEDGNETEGDDNYSENPSKIRKPVRPYNRLVVNETNLDLTPSYMLTQKQLLAKNIRKAKNHQAFYMSMIKGRELNADVNTSHDYNDLPEEEFKLLKDVWL